MKGSNKPRFDYGYLHDHSRVTRFRSDPVSPVVFLTNGRTADIPLDGPWHFAVDPYNSGLRGEWYRDQDEATGEVGPPDYDFDHWPEITVPSCWNSEKQELAYYEGAAWYVRDFDGGALRDGHDYYLGFEGTSGETVVFLNGEHVGYHDSGGVPFSIDLTGRIREGRNRLAIWVDNTRRADSVPGDFFDWYNYGGLFRSVALYIVPSLRIAEYRLYLDAEMHPVAEVRLSRAQVMEITVAIGEESFPLQTDGSGRVTADLDFEPRLWSPDDPHLYEVEVTVSNGDKVRDSVGFRRVEVRGTEVYLNGTPIFVRGVAVHEDHPLHGRSLTTEDRRTIIRDSKEMGANALRLAHYPHHPEMARLADEQGVLLWEEIPVYWHLNFGSRETLDRAMRQLEALIRRDFNRASVMMWSIGNENPDTDGRLGFMAALADHGRQLDPSRLITAACLVDVAHFRVTDRLVDTVDVVSLNQYYGWYYPGIERVPEILSSVSEKPVMISEFGAAAGYRSGNGSQPKWSEEYQAKVYDEQFSVLAHCPNLVGTFPWLLYDFASPRRLNAHQNGINRKGLISRERHHRKLAFEVVRDRYRALRG